MPYVDNSGVKIHYHVEGDGSPLVIQHGLTSSLQNWYAYGYVEELKNDYRLILVDARGHGLSDKPHDPAAYDLELRVSDILAVMDDLGVDKAHYLGYSMGGRIGFGLVKHALGRFHSFAIGGMGAHVANTDTPPERRIGVLRDGIDAYVANAEADEGPMEAGRKARLLENDAEALIAATLAPMGTEEIPELLPGLNLPFLIYCGDADGFYPAAKASAEAIPGCEFVTLPGLNHGEASRSSEPVLPHITKFLREAANKVGAEA
ncbi:MAG: alpha/beta fold hydrolase [Dehalococcoidia bacterium]|nr:alpha/beta fold hydrolase [Dehalococcoidia bacterium]|tara:strand:- start:6967 stop:7752 length:786 start_codon:yes stop_codon:yes gene_type:complete